MKVEWGFEKDSKSAKCQEIQGRNMLATPSHTRSTTTTLRGFAELGGLVRHESEMCVVNLEG